MAQVHSSDVGGDPSEVLHTSRRGGWQGCSRHGLLALALILIVSGAIGLLTSGFEGDISENKAWSRHLVRNGMRDAYRIDIDYAPVPLYVFAGVGWLYQATIDPSWNERAAQASPVFSRMMKAPMLLAHVGIAALLLAIGSVTSQRLGVLAALAYGLNPAALYNIAHFGQADALVGLFAVACLAALHWRNGLLLGICAACLLLSKPQGWILLPIIGVLALGSLNVRGLALAFTGGLVSIAVLVSPWALTGRAHHIWRYLENLNTHALSNRVISADAHNLWWIPTLLHGDWIEGSAVLVGPLSYRSLAVVLALAWLAFCFWTLRARRGHPAGLVMAAASFGFFMLMTRAHENHGYLTLPLLACALAVAPGRMLLAVYGAVSLGLLANLVLRDPLVMGVYTSVPDMGQPSPFLIVALQCANLVVFGVALVLMAGALLSRPRAAREAVRA